MSVIIPSQRQWSVDNSGDVFGSLAMCKNVIFDERGYIKVAPKAVSIYSNSDNADFERPLSIFSFSGDYFILTSGSCFSLGPDLAISEIASSPSTSNQSDAVAWQDKAYVSLATNLQSYDGSSWSSNLKSLTSAVAHPLEVMSNFSGGHLVVGNGNTVLRLDTSHNTVVTLTLNSIYEVTCLKYFQNNLYIGTKTNKGRDAKMFIWNGSGTNAQSEVSSGSNWIFSLEEYDSSIVAVTSEGQLRRYSGGGFTDLANFPVYYTRYRWTKGQTKVQRRGMKVDGDLIYINMQGAVSNVDDYYYIPEQPSGVWCYDPSVGLYCRHLSTTDPLLSVNVSSVSSSVLTLASSIRATTGEPIYLDAAGSLTGVTANTTYYVIKVSDTTIKLATTPANAHNGVSVTIGGSAGAASVKVVSYTQYGEPFYEGEPGAIGLVYTDPNSVPIFPELTRTTLIWGHEKDSSYYLNCLTTASNVGSFVTRKVWSPEVSDSFQKLFVKFANLFLDSEKIVFKTRSSDIYGLPTMAVDGTFSTNQMVGSGSDLKSQVVDGNNLNILTGNGAGRSFEITVDGDEFALDQSVPSASSSNALTFNVDNFKKKTVATNVDDLNYKEVTVGDGASWNQVMVELQGQNIKIEEIQHISTVNQQLA